MKKYKLNKDEIQLLRGLMDGYMPKEVYSELQKRGSRTLNRDPDPRPDLFTFHFFTQKFGRSFGPVYWNLYYRLLFCKTDEQRAAEIKHWNFIQRTVFRNIDFGPLTYKGKCPRWLYF